MLCTLNDFPDLPESSIPLCEIEGKLHFAPHDHANIHTFTSSVSSHPHVSVTKDVLHHISSKSYSNRVFLPVEDSLGHRLQNAWHDGGIVQVLEILANQQDNSFIVGNFIASWLLFGHRVFLKAKAFLSSSKSEEKVLNRERYKVGPIEHIAWHPHCPKLAISTRDDAVSIYSTQCQLNPVLKAKTQRLVSCIAWRPLSESELAVGCSEGVYIWVIDPNSVISRPSVSCATLLKAPTHRRVTSVAWSPQGDLLATASWSDYAMYIWDADMKDFIPLRRIGGGGVSLLSWSPNSSMLFAATTTTMFRIWDCNTWEPDIWYTLGGDVIAVCWAPEKSDMLLFVTRSDPYLYALPSVTKMSIFVSPTITRHLAAHVVADFTRVQLDSGYTVGGEVANMVWDKRGKHLAVMFVDCSLIAVYTTNIVPHFFLAPGFFIKGAPGEIPSTICFQDDFLDGANLTIAWNNGRVQYFPIIFSHIDTSTGPNITATSFTDHSLHY